MCAAAAPWSDAPSLLWLLPLSIAVPALYALFVGSLSLRTKGVYFIMVTLAFAQMLFFLAYDTKIAGGNDGIFIDVRPVARIGDWQPFNLDNFVHVYFLVLVFLVLVYLLLTRTYTGAAIRAIAQDRQIMPLMGVDTRRIYLITSGLGGALAGLAACLLVLQYDVHPFVGLTFGPITFLICVLGSLGNFGGGFVAAFVFAEIISVGGLYLDLEWGYVFAFAFFIVMMFVRPEGLMARRS